MAVTRGTTNKNVSGNSEDRRRRKQWMLVAFAADVLAYVTPTDEVVPVSPNDPVLAPYAVPACRCYRCGRLLTFSTLTIDRIIPGCRGGTYRRNNIRPACGKCNSETGGRMRKK